NATGDRWLAVDGAADVTVHRARFDRCRYNGWYTAGSHAVLVDPACCPGDGLLRSAVAHELLHHVVRGHVCRFDGEAPDWIASLRGPAVLNPHLTYGWLDYTERPTALDVAARQTFARHQGVGTN